MSAELATTLTATDDQRLMQAESVVRAHCGWHIAPVRTEVVILDGLTHTLLLPSLRVLDVTLVTQGGEEVAATDYEFTTGGVLRCVNGYGWLGHDLSWGRATWAATPLEVTITHGYAEAPPSVVAVVQAMAARAISNPGSLIRSQVGPFSETYSQTGTGQALPLALLDAERHLLAPYTLPKRL